MPNFANGKIYCIRSHQTERIYVGSTTQPLSVRFGEHKRHPSTSSQILQYPDAYIELLENYSCADKNELNRREGELIRTMNCVNKQIPNRTRAEHYQDNKEQIKEKKHHYYQYSKPYVLEQCKKRYVENKQEILEQMKQYYIDNKEHINKKNKKYYQDNKQEIKAKQHQKHNCCCGGRYTNSGKSQHFKRTNHIEFVSEFHNRLRTLLHA
jgi:hypothetical protein